MFATIASYASAATVIAIITLTTSTTKAAGFAAHNNYIISNSGWTKKSILHRNDCIRSAQGRCINNSQRYYYFKVSMSTVQMLRWIHTFMQLQVTAASQQQLESLRGNLKFLIAEGRIFDFIEHARTQVDHAISCFPCFDMSHCRGATVGCGRCGL